MDNMNMSEDSIRIKRIRVKDLPTFAANYIKGVKPGTFIPITIQRAESQAKNPLVDPDNVGLLVAFLGEEVVGYFGMLPMKLVYGTGSSTVWYFTGWNVADKVRGKGVGRLLMREAISLNQDYILAASKFGRKASAQSGLVSLPIWNFVRITLNRIWHYNPFTLTLRVSRKVASLFGKNLNIEKPSTFFNSIFISLFGWVGRPVLNAILLAPYRNLFQELTLQRVKRVRDGELKNKSQKPTICFYRDTRVVNWMLSQPWVLPPGQSPTEEMEYYFADTRLGFEYLPYEVYSHGEYKGFIVLQYSYNGREKRLKVLDVDLPEISWILPIALKVGAEIGIDFYEMNADYAFVLKGKLLGRMLIDVRKRIYQYYAASEDSPLIKYGEEIYFDHTDGDFSFT
jgi:GNAT superfamily N-acetyltransferase